MPPKSVEWRRILTSESKGEPRGVQQAANPTEVLTPSSAASIGTVLQSYEQIYLEKEQLRSECHELRRQLNRLRNSQNSDRPSYDSPRASEAFELLNQLRDCVENLRKGLHALEIEVSRLREAQSASNPAPEVDPKSRDEGNGHPRQAAPILGFAEVPVNASIAKMVAEWMFADPNAAQIRLVEDALRSQNFRTS